MAARALMSPHMSNDNSVTVASRTPLMMGMSDKYTCGRRTRKAVKLGCPTQIPRRKSQPLSSLTEGTPSDKSVSCDSDALRVWGEDGYQSICGRAMSLWAAPLPIPLTPLRARAQGHRPRLLLTSLSSCHHQHTRV